MSTTSKKAKKQGTFDSPLHTKHKLMHSHLSKELRAKYKTRAISVRKGDKVKVMVGQFKKKTGIVSRINLKKMKAYVEGIELTKRDGSKAPYPLHPSNLMITELNMDDKLRKQKLGVK